MVNKLNRLQRVLVLGAWALVLCSTLYPPVLVKGVANAPHYRGKFVPIYEVFWTAYSSPVQFLYIDHGVDWATLLLIWTWIMLGLIAGLWVFRTQHPVQ